MPECTRPTTADAVDATNITIKISIDRYNNTVSGVTYSDDKTMHIGISDMCV